MIDFRKTYRLLRVTWTMAGRAAREDALPLAVAPIVIGGAFYAFSGMGERIYAKLQARLSAEALSAHLLFGLFVAVLFCLSVALPNLIRDLFAAEPEDRYVRTLPIRRSERLLAIMTLRWLRNLIPGAALGYAVYWLRTDFFHVGPAASGMMAGIRAALVGLLFALLLAPMEIIVVMVLARLRALTWARFAPALGLVLAVSFALHREGWDSFNPLLYPLVGLWALIESPSGAPAALLSAATAVILAFAAASAFKAWAEAPLPAEVAGPTQDARMLWAFFRRFPRGLLDPQSAALLKRDLILTRRVFHRGILLNVAIAGFFLLLMVFLIGRYQILAGESLFVLATGTCALSAFSLSLIAARLLKYQKDFLWIDQCSHVSAESIWLGKVVFTNLLSLIAVPPLTVAAVAAVTGAPWRELGLIFIVGALITSMVASFTGSLVYEFEGHPLVALFFCFMASVPLAFFMVASYWWLVFIVFPFAMHHLKNRGLSRIKVILKYG